MASELRVDTLKDSSGNNSVGMSYVAGGSAKLRVNFDGSASSLSADGSFNLSSLTDNGTGDHTVNATSSFSDRHYSVSGSVAFEDGLGNYTNSMRVLSINSYTSPTTSALRINTSYSNSNNEDCDIVTPVIHGDLA